MEGARKGGVCVGSSRQADGGGGGSWQYLLEVMENGERGKGKEGKEKWGKEKGKSRSKDRHLQPKPPSLSS